MQVPVPCSGMEIRRVFCGSMVSLYTVVPFSTAVTVTVPGRSGGMVCRVTVASPTAADSSTVPTTMVTLLPMGTMLGEAGLWLITSPSYW